MERVRACWVYSWWEPLPIRPHTLSPSTPWSPSRLSGRAADRLSDEMMTLLWEVIPKWKVSGKDDAPFSHPPLHSSPPRLAANCGSWLICFRWRAGSTHWFSSVLSKKYLFTVVSLGHGRDLSRQFPNGARSKRGWFSLPYYKINGLQYYFRNKSISSVTKWILISYNETWVWLELFQQVCCTRHRQRVAIQLVISQLGQDKPHTLMVRTHISCILLTIIQLNYLIHFLNASYNFPTRPADQ